jgi:isopenicillin-N N-acyltransferase-like protein
MHKMGVKSPFFTPAGDVHVNRREFLKSLGKAGLAASAAGILPAALARKAFAAGDTPKVIHLHGTPEDMGRQYAEQIGELVIERIKRYHSKGSRVNRKLVEQSRIFLLTSANDIRKEIVALAAALGEEAMDLLMLAAEPPGVGIRQGGCSSFAVNPDATANHKTWAGQNIDDAGELSKFGIVIVRHPAQGVPMMTWALAGGIGGIGMNLAGVALTMNYVEAGVRKPLAAIFPEFIANAALRQKTYKDARAVLGSTQIMDPVIFTVASATGEYDTIERTPHRFSGLARGPLFNAATNHFRSPQLRVTEPEKPVFGNSKDRLARLQRLLNRKGITGEALRKVLADKEGSPRGICREEEPSTIASVLMCLDDRTLWATSGRPDRAKYGEYKLTAKPQRE